MMPNSDSKSDTPPNTIQRRRALALLGMGGFAVASHLDSSAAFANQSSSAAHPQIQTYSSLKALREDQQLQEGALVNTLGYLTPGDGGSAFYQVSKASPKRRANDGDVIALANGLQAVLLPDRPVNYHMFGVVGDGKHDDGLQIKLAHQFASRHLLPIIHLSGEYWIHNTHEIPISTNVEWGKTIFHINEKFNEKRKSRFIVQSLQKSQTIQFDEKQKTAFLKKLQPGVIEISELAPYKNHLVVVSDSQDKIGFRSGDRYKGQSWSREEFFYVEEAGRILGDIAWKFKDYTSLVAYPCDDTYLTINGGGFYLSGDNPGEKYTGYYSNGFSIQRSRTVVQNQWIGLEPDKADISMEPRSGFFTLSRVYDVTLENIRLIPWVYDRPDLKQRLGAGTYGISGARMLNCTFRNLTADGTSLHWGVFGTNLNKNFRIESCRLNRVDVHFHCWNLTIQDSVIGVRGISITGGGHLIMENTSVHNNNLVNFRRDFGAKWDGDISIRNCRLVSPNGRDMTVLSSSPAKFNYGYPIGCGRSIQIENLVLDFSQFPQSNSTIWLLSFAPFSIDEEKKSRHFFPELISIKNVTVRGRTQGVRVANIPEPYNYLMTREGSFDGDHLRSNCQMVLENIVLENIPETVAGSPESAHLRLGSSATTAYLDNQALYPQIRITACPNLCLHLGGSAAEVVISDSSIDRLNAASRGSLRGRLTLNNCQFIPRLKAGNAPAYELDAELGTWLSNCTIHAPVVDGTPDPKSLDRIDFVQVNKRVRYFQLNTTFSNRVLTFLKEQKIELQPAFIAMLKSHHNLEAESLS